jgi:hypothetical protein
MNQKGQIRESTILVATRSAVGWPGLGVNVPKRGRARDQYQQPERMVR